MPAARAWLVGRNGARGAHGWNRLPGSSATVWSRRAVLLRAGGYVQKFRTLPGFLWDPGSARKLFVKADAGARECRTNCWSRSHPSQWAAGSPFSALLSAQLQRNPPQLACRADPGTQGNPGSVRNFWTYPPALNSTARLRHTVAELPGRQFQRCAPRAAFLPTSQARAAGIAPTTTSFSVAQLRIAQFAGTESVDFACTPLLPYM